MIMALAQLNAKDNPKEALEQMNSAKANLVELQKGLAKQMSTLALIGGDTDKEVSEEKDFGSENVNKFLNSMKEEAAEDKTGEMAIDALAHKDWAKLAEDGAKGTSKPNAALME